MDLILSNTNYGAIEGVIERFKARFDEGEHIFIVPDRFSMSMEKRLLESLNLTSSFNVEVVTFNRLAKKIMGNAADRCLTPEGSVLLLEKVVMESEGNLKYFKSFANRVSFARDLYATLTELRNSAVSANDLYKSAENMPKGIKDKIYDTAYLLEGYENALSEKVFDSTTRLKALADEISKQTLSQSFYVCGFSSYKAPELKIVEILNKTATYLCVGAVSGAGNANSRIYPYSLVAKLRNFEGVSESRYNYRLEKPFETISKYLFSYERVKPAPSGGKVKVKEFYTPFEETRFVAGEIAKAVREGRRYKDFTVAICDGGYAPIIKSVFGQYGIPFFIDKGYLVSQTVTAKYLLSLMRAVIDNYSLDSVLDFMKNPLFGEDCFDFENYCLKYSVDFVTRPFKFGEYEEPEKLRQKFEKLALTIPSKGKASDFSDALQKLLKSAVDNLGESLALTSLYKKLIDGSAKKIYTVLDEASAIMGDEQFETEEFYRTFSSAIAKLEVSVLPMYSDCVIIGDAESTKFYDTKNLFVLGANEGFLPRMSDGGVLLNHRAEDMLSKNGITLLSSAENNNISAMLSAVDMLISPSEKLWVSYSAKGADEQTLTASNVAAELKNYFSDCDNEDETKDDITDYCTLKNCFFKVMESMENPPDESHKKLTDAAYSVLTAEQKRRIEKLAPRQDYLVCESQKIKSTSVSRLEKFYGCPYSYYFAYMLGLKKREETSIMSTETGTIIHAVLEAFFRNEEEVKNINSFVEEQFAEIFKDERLKSKMEKSGDNSQIMRLKAECKKIVTDLDELSKRSKFKPIFVEAEFADTKDGFGAIKLDTKYGTVELRGKIDRVDAYDGYCLIIDYKSFKSASLSLSDVYFGKKLQLYIYLSALVGAKNFKPAGAFYLPLFNSYTDGKRYSLKGQALLDKDILSAIDSECSKKDESLLDISFDGNQEVKSTVGKENKVLTNGQFNTVMEYAKKVAAKGAELISEGFIKASPVKGNCDVCDFSEICSQRDKNPRSVSAGRSGEIIEKMEKVVK